MTFSFLTVMQCRQISAFASHIFLADSANSFRSEVVISDHFFSFAVFQPNLSYRYLTTRLGRCFFVGGTDSAPIVRNRLEPPPRYGAVKFQPRSPISSRETIKDISSPMK